MERVNIFNHINGKNLNNKATVYNFMDRLDRYLDCRWPK